MEFNWLEKILTVLVAIFTAWGVMRERMLKNELKVEQVQKQLEALEDSHEELKERIYRRFDSIEKMLQEIMLKLERNNVR
ncbi:MAG: hypothetical protein Fur0027_07260 [Raineya sp.]